MSPVIRKFALVCHVASSVGWLGSVVAFLALAISAVPGTTSKSVEAAYLSMETIGWTVIVPLSIASFVSGVVQSLGTSWGLIRHYWIVTKLAITVGASLLLLLHMKLVSTVAAAARTGVAGGHHLQEPRMQVIADAGGAVVVLLIATVLSIYKPPNRGRWLYVLGAAIAAIVIAVIMRHLGGLMPSHI